MDETSDIFLNLTKQLYVSFLEDFPSRSAVVYEVTKWDNYVFTYDHGNKIDVTRQLRTPIAMDKWQWVLNPSCGVYVTYDMRSGAFKDSYLHLIWPEVYRRSN